MTDRLRLGLEFVDSIKDQAVRAELEQLVAALQKYVSTKLSGENNGDVTLAGSPNYLTIDDQEITRHLIDLSSHVTNRLPYVNFTAATAASRLLGRGSASGAGDWEEVVLGTNLSMSGTTLNATGGSSSGASWIPLVDGSEPPVFLTDGAGNLILVAYGP